MMLATAVVSQRSGVFGPTDIAGCVGWWDADDATTITATGSDVTQWDDKSGAGHHFVQASAGKYPQTGTATINAKNVLSFDGTADSMSVASFAGLNGSADMTMFAVIESSATGDRVVAELTSNYSTAAAVGFISFQTNTGRYMTQGISDPSFNIYRTTAIANATPYLLSWTANRATTNPQVNVYLDTAFNSTAGSVTNNTSGTFGTTGLYLGARNNASLFWSGKIAEVLLYDSVLSTSNRRAIESYLIAKWKPEASTATTVGTYNSGEGYTAYVPVGYNGAKPIVFYMHGYGSDHTQMQTASYNGVIDDICFGLAELGYVAMSIDGGGTSHWGNDTMIASIDAAIAYANASFGAPTTNVSFIGGSMGGLSLAWIRVNLADTGCFVGLTPVSDLTNSGVDTPYGANIDTAYGGTYSNATDGPAHNPVVFAAGGDLAGLAYKSWYGASDTTVPGSTVTAVAASIGGTASAVSVTGTHGTAISNVPVQDVIDFVVANT